MVSLSLSTHSWTLFPLPDPMSLNVISSSVVTNPRRHLYWTRSRTSSKSWPQTHPLASNLDAISTRLVLELHQSMAPNPSLPSSCSPLGSLAVSSLLSIHVSREVLEYVCFTTFRLPVYWRPQPIICFLDFIHFIFDKNQLRTVFHNRTILAPGLVIQPIVSFCSFLSLNLLEGTS